MTVTTAPSEVGSDAGNLPGGMAGFSLADVVDTCIAHLGVPMSRTDALKLLGQTASPLAAPCQNLLAEYERDELVCQMVGLIILLERGPFPADADTAPEVTGVAPHQRAMLEASADLADAIAGSTGDVYWRCIALSLRAECLHLLGDRHGAEQAASQSQTAYSGLSEPSASADHLAAYCRDLLMGTRPPVTTRRFLDSLHDEVLRMSKTAPCA